MGKVFKLAAKYLAVNPILTIDFETDPFEHGKRVYPFACGLADDSTFTSCWGAKCAEKMVELLSYREPSTIYMHNGGRFDIYFFYEFLEPEMRVINGRIVKATLKAGKVYHEIRDSYSILPFPLKKYDKIDIDISKLHRSVRDQHREEILRYLQRDCTSLRELVTAFYAEFGDFLTVGSAAMAQLRKFHPFEKGNRYTDEKFRKTFFYGGRVQCFKAGLIRQPYTIYDVNSMYPYVMQGMMHPTGRQFYVDNKITKDTAFVVVTGKQQGPYGAFPSRNPKTHGIDFTRESGTFHVSIHEWQAAEECGYFKADKIEKTYDFDEWICFDEFVHHFYNERRAAILKGDKIHELFFKFILNSAYGKFAQNPEHFKDFAITKGSRTLQSPWKPVLIHGLKNGVPEYAVWSKQSGQGKQSYYNVAIGASITGASRATLLRGLRDSTDALYCDTDSIIATNLRNLPTDNATLGSWKIEGHGDSIAIAGKKLYACFAGERCIKKATKGGKISAEEIVKVAQGAKVLYKQDAPTFKLDGSVRFMQREIKRTV